MAQFKMKKFTFFCSDNRNFLLESLNLYYTFNIKFDIKTMNRLVIIGNGFDLAHGLKTSYADFLEWYINDFINRLENESSTIYDKDPLCTVRSRDDYHSVREYLPIGSCSTIEDLEKRTYLRVSRSNLLSNIMHNYKEKGWVDIEEIYYTMLKKYIFNDYSIQTKVSKVKELNEQLDFLKRKLIEYLSDMEIKEKRKSFGEIIHSAVDIEHEVVNSISEAIKLEYGVHDKCRPTQIMMLSFNYTSFSKLYCRRLEECLYIHGSLLDPNTVVFGYGDELDDDYKNIAKCNENEYLKHFKSYKYLERSVYKDVLRFIESDKFQIMILGHSCGNSDRTLLNTLFNHKNCISIKPYYYINDKGEDNYSDLIMNISRSFNDTADMRSKVVDKEHCNELK